MLWFTYCNTRGKVSQNIDEVYLFLVPSHSRTALGGIGVMGGISVAVGPDRSSIPPTLLTRTASSTLRSSHVFCSSLQHA